MNDFWQVILPNWINSIGTAGAVIVALFQYPIRRWLKRPRLRIICSNKTPLVEKLVLNTESSSNAEELRIRIKVINEGKDTADHCLVNIDCYFEKRAKDDLYCKKEFTPILIKDYRNTSSSYISPNLTYYLDIASIRKTDEMAGANDDAKYRQFYKLFLLGDRAPIKLGTGTFIIPIKISAPKIKPYIGYLKIYWDGNDFVFDGHNFSVEMLSDKNFNSLKKINYDSTDIL